MATASMQNKSTKSEALNFEVSAGLKRIIGRDLITDDEVAIFELVKNSFDAGASKVQLFFNKDKIVIVDDGHGMSKDDIINKWLLVAYSSKKLRIGSDDHKESYRDQIESRRSFAGSKGIGRFSSDRLGHKLRLQSSTNVKKSQVHVVNVDWDHFEKNERQNFINVQVEYNHAARFELPSEIQVPSQGTVVEITALRSPWDRSKLLSLKASLAKLINPFGLEIDPFALEVIAPLEQEEDQEVNVDFESWTEEDKEYYGFPYYSVVNGQVRNFIFEALAEKTTFIHVCLVENDTLIETTLTDRGEEVYKIREHNPYTHLRGSELSFLLFYLNTSAKMTFARRMGVSSKKFGSVFLFRNAIRVYPFGEDGDDTLGMDARKQQGTKRYLGTRDVIGRINVSGDEEHFKEATSRDAGLVDTPAYLELIDCFWEKCLKRLEKYVVGVSWAVEGDRSATDLSSLLNDEGRSRVADVVASLARAKDIQLISYSENLVQILDEKAEEFEGSLKSIRAVAEETKNTALLEKLAKAEKRFHEIRESEAEQRKLAEEAKEKEVLARKELEFEREKNQYLLKTRRTLSEDADGLIHTIKITNTELNKGLNNLIHDLSLEDEPNTTLIERLGNLRLLALKSLKMAELATFSGTKDDIEVRSIDIPEYVKEYIHYYVENFDPENLEIEVAIKAKHFFRSTSVLNLSIILDNLISNSTKWGASKIYCGFQVNDANDLEMIFSDNGYGLSKELVNSPERIFELGIKATPPGGFSGSGIGLYYSKSLLNEMGAEIEYMGNGKYLGGATFRVVFRKT